MEFNMSFTCLAIIPFRKTLISQTGLFIVLSRSNMIFFASFISGNLSGDLSEIYRNKWLGFIMRAGARVGDTNI